MKTKVKTPGPGRALVNHANVVAKTKQSFKRKSWPKRVIVGTKGRKFRIYADKSTDVLLFTSPQYSNNNNATRGAKRVCKSLGFGATFI